MRSSITAARRSPLPADPARARSLSPMPPDPLPGAALTDQAYWTPDGRGAFRQAVLWLLREPFTQRARKERLYSLFGLPLAIAGFAFTVSTVIVGLGMSLSFAGMLAGLPLLAVSSAGGRRLAAVNRGLAGRLLGLQVAPPPPLHPEPGLAGWIRAGLADPASWRARAYLVLKLPVSVLSFAVALSVWTYGLAYLTYPLWWQVLDLKAHLVVVDGLVLALPSVRTLPAAFALIPLGAAMVLLAPWALRVLTAVDEALIAGLLGPAPVPQRVRDLEQTRAHAVDGSAARLRRIERDLHDGAQAQMVAVAMKLGLAREKLGRPAAQADVERVLELVDAAHRSAKEAITELRDLARGIHPPVLDHGLGTALATLAARSAMPVELVVDLPERPSAAIETIAYFCAAELLANVAKHSGARHGITRHGGAPHATLEAVHVPGLLRVRVSDDGTGGARVEPGGGLAGLAERVRTVDGRLEITSPRGGPTVVTVEMPSHA